MDEKCWNEFRNSSSTEGDGSQLNCLGCNLFAHPKTRITLIAMGALQLPNAVKYLRNDERLESDSRRGVLLTLLTGSNLFCLLWVSRIRMTEDEMVGWHHQLIGLEFEQTLGDSKEQRNLVCCSPWGHKESDMTVTEQSYQGKTLLRSSIWAKMMCQVVPRKTLGRGYPQQREQ